MITKQIVILRIGQIQLSQSKFFVSQYIITIIEQDFGSKVFSLKKKLGLDFFFLGGGGVV